MTSTLAAPSANETGFYRSLTVAIKGRDSMLLHNGALASPLNSVTRAIKSINAKKQKKTERDIEMLAELEVVGGLYLSKLDEEGNPDGLVSAQIELGETDFVAGYENPDDRNGELIPFQANQIVMPAINLEAMMLKGAKKSRWGTDFKTGVLVPSDVRIQHSLEKKSLQELLRDENFVDSRLVVVQRSRIMRTRPMLKNWSLQFEISYMPSVVSQSQIEKALDDASMYVGLGDYTPRYGKFEVLKVTAND